MYTSDNAASASQIDLGFPLPPGHLPSNSTQTLASNPAQRAVYPSGLEGGRTSTSTAASSHASTSTARDRPRSVNGFQSHEHDREDVEEEEARTPEKAPGGAVDKAVMASALVPAGAGVAAAALTQHRVGHGERGDGEMAEKLGIEDKHHFFAPQLKGQRRSVYKKNLLHLPRHHSLALGLPVLLLGIDLQAHVWYLQPERPLRHLRHGLVGPPQRPDHSAGQLSRVSTLIGYASWLGGTICLKLSKWSRRCAEGGSAPRMLGVCGGQCERDIGVADGGTEWGWEL